jgi:hypothetical protein
VSTIDLNNPPSDYHYSLSVNKEETTAERNVRLTKEMAVFSLAVVFVGCIYWLAFSTVTSQAANAEEKKWAMSVLWEPLAWSDIWFAGKAGLNGSARGIYLCP